MSEQPTPTTSVLTCCGEGGAWVIQKKGDPQIPSCMLCPRAGAGHWDADGTKRAALAQS